MNAPDGDVDDAALRGSDPVDWPVVSQISRGGARDVFRAFARRKRLADEGSPAVGDAIADPWTTESTAWGGRCPDGASQGPNVDDHAPDRADADDGEKDVTGIGASS